MTRFLLLAAAFLAAAPVSAADLTRSATASVRITTLPGNVRVVETRNVTFTTYDSYFGGVDFLARVVQIDSHVLSRTDAEGSDPASRVTITVEDLATGKRLSRIEAPGTEGAIPDPGIAVVTQPGCCASPNTLRVFHADSGRFLFRATGAGPYGSASWAGAPNSRPEILRWAAYTRDESGDPKRRRLGWLVYGGLEGAISAVELREALTPAQAEKDEYAAELSMNAENGAIHWIGAEPVTGGTPVAPASVWALNNLKDPAKFGGVSVALVAFGKTLVTIPVESDRLMPAKAVAGPYVTVAPAALPLP